MARFRILGWSLVGAFMGFLLGVFVTLKGVAVGPLVVPATTLFGWAVVFFVTHAILGVAGRAGGSLYAPSGRSTRPRAKEYSLAESYVARGLHDEAITAFEQAVGEGPDDPTPYLRIARIRRDRIGDLDGAATWFRKAVAESTMPPGVRLLVLREYVELCSTRLDDPLRALPTVARIAEQYADGPDGTWARETLAELRALRDEAAVAAIPASDQEEGAAGESPRADASE